MVEGRAAKDPALLGVLERFGQAHWFEITESSIAFRVEACSEETKTEILQRINRYCPGGLHGKPNAFGFFMRGVRDFFGRMKGG
ncbi:MAG: hypothetical protein AAF492_16795 [Verrucomicrobiota bacterium]